eukprot:GFKZ01007127.1.p4 GENE.GFKZ01007127.1~~GFKZ01007127.1.p4  ORF type:complete len:114 (-),score=3.30 GFKZ01007127.1:344-685(-)
MAPIPQAHAPHLNSQQLASTSPPPNLHHYSTHPIPLHATPQPGASDHHKLDSSPSNNAPNEARACSHAPCVVARPQQEAPGKRVTRYITGACGRTEGRLCGVGSSGGVDAAGV